MKTKTKCTLSALAIRRLRRVQKQILKEPRQFQMRRLFTEFLDSDLTITNCGTAACIAGWLAVGVRKGLNPAKAQAFFCERDAERDPRDNWRASYVAACKQIGLGPPEENPADPSQRLFHVRHWPSRFRELAAKHKEGSAAYARNAGRRIEHFIKTDGAE